MPHDTRPDAAAQRRSPSLRRHRERALLSHSIDDRSVLWGWRGLGDLSPAAIVISATILCAPQREPLTRSTLLEQLGADLSAACNITARVRCKFLGIVDTLIHSGDATPRAVFRLAREVVALPKAERDAIGTARGLLYELGCEFFWRDYLREHGAGPKRPSTPPWKQ